MPSVLILTQYYPPETGAPQNRLSSLGVHLKKLGLEVSVLTAMPNYPAMEIAADYKGKWFAIDEIDDIPVYRTWIFVKKTKSVFLRLLNYFSFVFTSAFAGLFLIHKHDIILCESPPLFLGISARIIKLFKGGKIVFNVSDLWPESAEKLEIVTNKHFLRLAYSLERSLYKSASLVSGQTQGIIKSINTRFPDVKTFWLPNGVDTEKFNLAGVQGDWRKENSYADNDFIVLYAGILGYAQALEVILRAAQKTKEKKIKYVIVGDGPQKEYLHQLKEELQLTNVDFYPNQPSSVMPSIVAASNAAIIPLKNLPLFKGAIPSKLFENLAFAKPILLGVDGEAKELFIDKGNCGLFYTPDDDAELAKSVMLLNSNAELCKQLGQNGKAYVEEHFDRKKIATGFYFELIKL